MFEVAVVIGTDREPIYWHMDAARTEISIPDSQILWDVIWEHRDRVMGVAHTHPGGDVYPFPSCEDLSSFKAIEQGLGKRLVWWILNETHATSCTWYEDHYIVVSLPESNYPWFSKLRDRARIAP